MSTEKNSLSKILFNIYRNTTEYTNVVLACDAYQKPEVTKYTDMPSQIMLNICHYLNIE